MKMAATLTTPGLLVTQRASDSLNRRSVVSGFTVRMRPDSQVGCGRIIHFQIFSQIFYNN